jgi:beta-lactamase class A
MRSLIFVFLIAAVALGQAPAPQPPLARLQSNIERITKSLNADWGIYIKCLETGEEIAIDADRQMDTMSVIKIPLMVEAFRQIEEGKFALTDRVTLKEQDKRPGTGVIRSMDAGAVLTVKDLLTLMIIVSDNAATDLLYAKVGGVEPVNALMKRYGLTATRAEANADAWFHALRAAKSPLTFHQDGKHPFGLSSPRDIGRLLEMMEQGKAVSAKSSETMLQMMRGQVYGTRLPKYLTGVRLPHKTGDFLPYIGNDVGVLEMPGRTVVISVFTAHHYGVGTYLEDAIGRIAEQTANYFGFRP